MEQIIDAGHAEEVIVQALQEDMISEDLDAVVRIVIKTVCVDEHVRIRLDAILMRPICRVLGCPNRRAASGYHEARAPGHANL